MIGCRRNPDLHTINNPMPIGVYLARMKRNTFYLFIGIIAFIEIAIFWLSVQAHNPLPTQLSFVAGIVLAYGLRRYVEEPIEDERTNLITQKAALHTLEVFWVVFFVVSLGSAVIGFSRPLGIHPPHPPFPLEADMAHIGFFGILQMGMLALMVFLYVGFRLYFARVYGGFETDEE
jgi:uncharacterized membrane protein